MALDLSLSPHIQLLEAMRLDDPHLRLGLRADLMDSGRASHLLIDGVESGPYDLNPPLEFLRLMRHVYPGGTGGTFVQLLARLNKLRPDVFQLAPRAG